MIKQINMPTIIKTSGFEAQLLSFGDDQAKAHHEKRRAAFEKRIQEAEKELNAALMDGFTVVSNYLMSTDRHDEIAFVLFKRDGE